MPQKNARNEGACGHVSNSLPKLQEENWNPVGWNLPAVRGKKKETGGQTETGTETQRERDTERDPGAQTLMEFPSQGIALN